MWDNIGKKIQTFFLVFIVVLLSLVMGVVGFGQPSGELEERSERPTFRALQIQYGGKFIMGQGAVPIFRNDELIGACGVGGGTPQEDEDCARAGAELL